MLLGGCSCNALCCPQRVSHTPGHMASCQSSRGSRADRGLQGEQPVASCIVHHIHLPSTVNCLLAEGATQLADALRCNATLLRLNVAGNGLGDAGAQVLGGALETNTRLIIVDLCSNCITDSGLALPLPCPCPCPCPYP